MNVLGPPRSHRLFRTAAWFYVLPRAGMLILLLTALALTGVLLLIQVALLVLRPLGT